MTMLNPYNYSKPKQPMGIAAKKQNPVRSSLQRSSYGKTDNYLEQKVMSAKPEELTLMLYEGIIKFVKQAKLFNDRKDIEQSSRVNMRVQAIIQELRSTLDLSIEISESFESLYIYMNERLVEANAKKDNEILDEVLSLAEDFRNTWKEAMNL